MKISKYAMGCFAGLFFLGFLAGGRVLARDMYRPVMAGKRAGEGFEIREIEPIRPDSARWIKGYVVRSGGAEMSCFVAPTGYADVMEVNVGYKNLSESGKVETPTMPVEEVYADGEACDPVEVEAILKNLENKEQAEIREAEEDPVGQGIFNPVARKMKYSGERRRAESLKEGLYEAVTLAPGESVAGKLYYNAERPDKITVKTGFSGKTYTFDFVKEEGKRSKKTRS